MILKEEMTIIAHEEIAPKIFSMSLQGQMVAEMKPGQFVHIRVPDPAKLLRRPISICQVDKNKQVARIVYRIEGGGLERISTLKVGEQLDVMGPLGNGFDLSQIKPGHQVLLVGGGIGVPPMVQTAEQLKNLGASVTSVLGFASKSVLILEKELAQYGNVYVTTDDGSYGIKGYVSTVIDGLEQEFDAIYACGAPGMLKYIDEKFADHPQAYLSLEERMACGMGACYACVVHLKDKPEAESQRVCKEGPVFATGTVVL